VRWLTWLGLAGATVGGGALAEAAGLPSAWLFAALVAGLLVAVLAPARWRVALPENVFRVAQAVAGVAIGAYLQGDTLSGLGARWIPVILVSAATLVVTLAAGVTLARLAPVDRATAALGMVAGGASGIVAMARELGADDRLVAFMQYLRVLIVVVGTPLLVAVAFPGHESRSVSGSGVPGLGTGDGWLFVALCAPVGAALAALVRLPAGVLLGPVILAGVLSLTGVSGGTQVPPVLRETSFAIIGLGVGLRFERETVRAAAKLLLPTLATILGLLAACFGLAWILTVVTGVSLLNAYLATTPGGLYAVLPIAFGAGGDPTFVLAVQALRLFVMILAAPAAVRVIVRRHITTVA
jgi:uncharacterized protein